VSEDDVADFASCTPHCSAQILVQQNVCPPGDSTFEVRGSCSIVLDCTYVF